jgi:hypothetical protein
VGDGRRWKYKFLPPNAEWKEKEEVNPKFGIRGE